MNVNLSGAQLVTMEGEEQMGFAITSAIAAARAARRAIQIGRRVAQARRLRRAAKIARGAGGFIRSVRQRRARNDQ